MDAEISEITLVQSLCVTCGHATDVDDRCRNENVSFHFRAYSQLRPMREPTAKRRDALYIRLPSFPPV